MQIRHGSNSSNNNNSNGNGSNAKAAVAMPPPVNVHGLVQAVGQLVGVDVAELVADSRTPASARQGGRGRALAKARMRQQQPPPSSAVAPEDMTTDELELALAKLDDRFEQYKRAQW